jgi:polyhydroxyalkanoate synthesis regulator phasin
LHKKGVLIAAMALMLVFLTGTIAMASAGSLTRIESKWLDLQETVIKKMVKEGQITKEQADEELARMRKHLLSSGEDDVYSHISRRMGIRFCLLGVMSEAWAELSGQEPAAVLRTCREQGATVWELAKREGREDEWKEKALALAEERLSTLVQDGKLTDAVKTKILDRLKETLSKGNPGCTGSKCPSET